jgi:transcription initiation factor TFIID subunit 5
MTQRASSRKDSASAETNCLVNSFNEELHSSILSFIKKLGYRQTEQIFRDEARNAGIETVAFELRAEQDSSLQPAILLEKLNENSQKISDQESNDPERSSDSAYELMFSKLKKWTYNSLDIYRDELGQILYPIFIHCFLDLIAKNFSANGKFC